MSVDHHQRRPPLVRYRLVVQLVQCGPAASQRRHESAAHCHSELSPRLRVPAFSVRCRKESMRPVLFRCWRQPLDHVDHDESVCLRSRWLPRRQRVHADPGPWEWKRRRCQQPARIPSPRRQAVAHDEWCRAMRRKPRLSSR
jgi:hypothetical protein